MAGQKPPSNKPPSGTPLAKPQEGTESKELQKLIDEFDIKVWDKDGPIKIVSIKRSDDPNDFDLHIANGAGHISFQNGNIAVISGNNGSRTNPCAGKLVVKNSGEVRKSEGPINIEVSADDNREENGDVDPDAEEAPAYSLKVYGDYAVETVGGKTGIRGNKVVITAADTLTLIGESGLNLQAGKDGNGTMTISAGLLKKNVATEEEIITSQKTKIVSEDSTFQYDPRAAVNIVSPGHMNIKALGDISFGAGGVIDSFASGKPPLALPLVKARTATFQVRALKADGIAGIAMGAAEGDLNIDAAVGSANLRTATGDVNITAVKDVKITGVTGVRLTSPAMIYLN